MQQSAACSRKQNAAYLEQNSDGSESSFEDAVDSDDSESLKAAGEDQMDTVSDFGAARDSGYSDDEMRTDPPNDAVTPPPPENPRPAKRPRATLEEVEDEDDRWVQDFPEGLKAGAVIDECNSQFEKLRRTQKTERQEPWYPFQNEDEWEMARWLMTSGLSQGKIDQYLKLKSVCALVIDVGQTC
jgi:hypothetical protein